MNEIPAGIRADYADQKRVLTRKVLQIILEVPIEDHERVNKIIGLPSVPGESKWVGLALLDPEVVEKTEAKPSRQKEIYQSKTEGEKAVARAGIICGEREFQKWFAPHRGEQGTIDKLKAECGIITRAQLATLPNAFEIFLRIEQEYREAIGQAAEPRP